MTRILQIVFLILLCNPMVLSFHSRIQLIPIIYSKKVCPCNRHTFAIQCHENPPKKEREEKKLKNEYDTLINRCCGEVNETDELEQLERDFFEIYQKMRKYNTKRIIQTKQDLYKIFKKTKKYPFDPNV